MGNTRELINLLLEAYGIQVTLEMLADALDVLGVEVDKKEAELQEIKSILIKYEKKEDKLILDDLFQELFGCDFPVEEKISKAGTCEMNCELTECCPSCPILDTCEEAYTTDSDLVDFDRW